MKKLIYALCLMLLASSVIFVSCKKDEDEETTNNNTTTPTPTPTTLQWNINALVDLGGTFTVIATATTNYTDTTFTSNITTSQIGGAPEVHNITVTGVKNGTTFTVTNCSFTITVGSSTETVTIISGTHTYTNNNLTGSGTISVLPSGSSTPMSGTYTVTGTGQ